MRIVALLPLESPWSRNTALWLTRLNHAVHIVDFRRSDIGYLGASPQSHAQDIDSFQRSVAGVHLIDVPTRSSLRYSMGAIPLRKIVRDCRADVVLSLYSGGLLLMAYVSGCRPYATYVVGSDVLRIGGFRKWLGRKMLVSADKVFVNGLYLAERTRSLAPRANITPLYLGVDRERYSPGEPPASPVHIACTRGFLPIYNNEYLIRALALLPEPVPDFRVSFLSSGPLLASVRSLADKLLTADRRGRVEFLGGVTEGRLLSILRSSHVYVSLSRSDGTSISTLEALACGLFPVLSDIPPNREWVDPALGNGILVPLDRPEELATALARAMADPAGRARAAEINRRLVLERADASRNMQTLSAILEEVVQTHGT